MAGNIKSYFQVSGSGTIECFGTGEHTVITPSLIFTGMAENPNNPPANQLNIDGTYYPASPGYVTSIQGNTDNMAGAIVDDEGLYRFTGNNGNTTRYVFINENGYTMAMNNIDGVMNIYDNNTAINAGQGSRLGFVYSYSGVSTVINSSNTDCPTCVITPNKQRTLFQNL